MKSTDVCIFCVHVFVRLQEYNITNLQQWTIIDCAKPRAARQIQPANNIIIL